MRAALNNALKSAMKDKEALAVSTLRLIQAAVKDRDIAARTKGYTDGISDDEILTLLQSMIKQRNESIKAVKKGGRMELVEQEAGEIAVIERFLPDQMSDDEIEKEVDAVGDVQRVRSFEVAGVQTGPSFAATPPRSMLRNASPPHPVLISPGLLAPNPDLLLRTPIFLPHLSQRYH